MYYTKSLSSEGLIQTKKHPIVGASAKATTIETLLRVDHLMSPASPIYPVVVATTTVYSTEQ
jgi:hypothetical protein